MSKNRVTSLRFTLNDKVLISRISDISPYNHMSDIIHASLDVAHNAILYKPPKYQGPGRLVLRNEKYRRQQEVFVYLESKRKTSQSKDNKTVRYTDRNLPQRLTLRAECWKQLIELEKGGFGRNQAEIIRNSLAFYYYLLEHMQNGWIYGIFSGENNFLPLNTKQLPERTHKSINDKIPIDLPAENPGNDESNSEPIHLRSEIDDKLSQITAVLEGLLEREKNTEKLQDEIVRQLTLIRNKIENESEKKVFTNEPSQVVSFIDMGVNIDDLQLIQDILILPKGDISSN